MKIEFDPFNNDSIDSAVKKLKGYKEELKKKEQKLLEELAKFGATSVSINFSNAIPYLGFDPDIYVFTEITGNTAIIYAQGEQVAFVEFGAGVRFGYGYPGDRPEGIVGIGEYGLGLGNLPEGWYYQDEGGDLHHTYGNPPVAAMYNGSLEIAEQITTIAREVFRT